MLFHFCNFSVQWLIAMDYIQCNLPVSQNACPRTVALASYTKSLKPLLVSHARTFEMNKTNLTKYYASEYFKVNRSVMNVNCYFIVYFSLKTFYPHFRSFETCSSVISYFAACVCRHFPMMQCEFWPLLSQSLVAH